MLREIHVTRENHIHSLVIISYIKKIFVCLERLLYIKVFIVFLWVDI